MAALANPSGVHGSHSGQLRCFSRYEHRSWQPGPAVYVEPSLDSTFVGHGLEAILVSTLFDEDYQLMSLSLRQISLLAGQCCLQTQHVGYAHIRSIPKLRSIWIVWIERRPRDILNRTILRQQLKPLLHAFPRFDFHTILIWPVQNRPR